MKTAVFTVSICIAGSVCFAETFDGRYDQDSCAKGSDSSLSISGKEINFYLGQCTITKEKGSSKQKTVSVTCTGEEGDYSEEELVIDQLPNADLRITWSDGDTRDYLFCEPLEEDTANACSLVGATFQDEIGKNADVTKIEECFGWFDRDNQTASEGCATFEERSLEVKNSKSDVRVVGSRLYHMRYHNENVIFAEHVQFGVPWLFNSVNPEFDPNVDWVLMSKETATEMISGEDSFDFTDIGGSDESSGRFSLKQCGAM